MKKRLFIAIAAMILGGNCVMQAQNEKEEIIVTDNDGKEEAIDVPEAMNFEVDSLLNLYYSKTYLQPDNDCNLKDENVTYPKDVYIERLKRLPNVMEMPYNDIVQKFIDRYTGRLRHSVSYMLGASNFYTPIFEEALEAYGLPLELKYLPVIESALNPQATSRVGAAGLWQFMVATGKQYGLEVNSLVDERRDPVKSSYAAAQYLRDLYKIFGDWSLVIAAYNCGPGNVNKAIRRSGGKRDFWAIYRYLPRETRGYVPIFIAANYAMNYAAEHHVCPAEVDVPLVVDTVMVTHRIHFDQLAAVLGVDKEQVRMLNPQYRRDIIPGDLKPYALRLPLPYATAYVEQCDSVRAYKADELINNRRKEIEIYRSSAPGGSGKLIYHKVKSGETLGHIAIRYGTTASKIRQWNNISGSRIYAGQRLRIYK